MGQWLAGFESRLVPDLPLPFIPTLIGLRDFDLVSSPVWWEAVTNNISSIPHYSLSVLLYLSCNKTLFLSTNVLTAPFHSNTALSDCILFKDTTVATNDSIQTHSQKDPNTVRRTTVVIKDWTDSRWKYSMKTQKKKISVGNSNPTVTREKLFFRKQKEAFFFLKRNNVGKNLFFLFSVKWKKCKNRVAWLNMGFKLESLHYEKLRFSWKNVFSLEHCLRIIVFCSILLFPAKKKKKQNKKKTTPPQKTWFLFF